jgi:hypothetical protein
MLRMGGIMDIITLALSTIAVCIAIVSYSVGYQRGVDYGAETVRKQAKRYIRKHYLLGGE